MRNAASILLIIVLVVVTPVLLLVTSVKYNVATPRFLKHELASREGYDLAIAQLDAQLMKVEINPDYPITQGELINLAHQVITKEWLQSNVEGSIDHFFAWLNAPQGITLTVPIDLRQPKTQLASSVDSLLAEKIPQIKPCPSRRIPKNEQGLCQFSGMSVAQVKEEMKHAGFDVANLSSVLPDTLDLVNPDLSKITGKDNPSDQNSVTAKNQEIMSRLNKVKDVYQQAAQYLLYAWIVYGLLIAGFIALNATKGWSRLVRWLGILALSISLLPLLIGIGSQIMTQSFLLPKLEFDSKMSDTLQTAIRASIGDVQHALFFVILLTGIILFLAGLGAIIEAHFLRQPAPAKK